MSGAANTQSGNKAKQSQQERQAKQAKQGQVKQARSIQAAQTAQTAQEQRSEAQWSAADVPLQGASFDIWDKKYRLKRKGGEPVDGTIDETFQRVARTLAAVEEGETKQAHWYERFLWALRRGAVPAGRIISNAGAWDHKPATSTINCTVSGTIEDSMDGILKRVHEAGLTLKAGCGIGYEFSTLRPRGAYVSGAGAYTSGPLSFMDIYDRMCFTVSSAGGRRGAQMATFDIGHPDVADFIRAKREDGRLRQFNLSLLITDDFMEAVARDDEWPLAFPLTADEVAAEAIDLTDPQRVLWREWPIHGPYIRDESGRVGCRIYDRIKARNLWNLIMSSTYDYAEPGFILVDRVNEQNNNWFCEEIRATNPCGEQPLPPHGACLLGSVNLTMFVRDPFTEQARFDWEEFREVVAVFTRMLDNTVEINGLPLAEQRAEIERKRRHGMGFLGLGSTITMLRMRYGDAASTAFTEQVALELALSGWRTGLELAREKGPAPIMEELYEITPELLRKRPELVDDGYEAGEHIPARLLWARYSRYMQKLAEVDPQLVDELATVGARFTHHSSIAPTGTISLSLANNASNGIEPSFAHHYVRNLIREGRKTKESVDVFSFELLAYRHFVDEAALPEGGEGGVGELPDYFVSAEDVTPQQHVDIQAAAQKWIDSSISKTANVPTDYPYEAFKDIYRYAYEQGLKGCTTFRFNPEVFQGVLVKEKDLSATTYRFRLADGSFIEARGDEQIEYDGEVHTAANLYEALKEGYYGRF
ncbi:ribonucleoside-diphosphate reductase, adenosylcobalamin-dependent [Halorhodospira abdelmalekii]|uniref:adenosylcobalamin-dependent ribonucleoside-diphosphate reductase n=1 Tax=Halorhodospira abdelmalekii TaxID=421629 RepID=UPI0019086D8B|nr:adenosylcobalamin-dependent ribonucleoside-diphosphate reductase [Halorhodospira abdelmalekii]MBK1735878.1 ribonucleoside-diphosphate reductase, adenosylcobalamin-dependent [Halorhodospira abdelmalekii]